MTASKPVGTLVLAAALAGLAGPTFAQTAPETAPSAPTETPAIAPSAGAVNGAASFDEVLDGIRRDTANHTALSTISTVGSLRIVRMSQMDGADTLILADATASHATRIGRLRDTLAANGAHHLLVRQTQC